MKITEQEVRRVAELANLALRDDEIGRMAHDLDEILTDEGAVVIIEWGERLGRHPLPAGVWQVSISGDGDSPRQISITQR